MPMYEYRCKSCSHEFEVLQNMSAEPLATCEKCAGPLEKLISRSGFQLKGSGWYVSDYGKGGSAAAAARDEKGKAEKSSSDSASGGDSKGADSKSDVSTASGSTPSESKASESKGGEGKSS